MNNLFLKIGAAAAVLGLVLSIVALVGGNQPDAQVGGGTRFPSGISADSTSPSAGEVRGTTLTVTGASTFSGDVSIPTVQGATSTIVVGQTQTYATSAATVICQKYLAVATTSANGFVTWSYGACP